MKIEAITLRELHMPLVHFFETSFGRIYDRRVMLVTVHCEGVDGWGECVADEGPYFSEECVETAWPVLRQFLIPLLLGKTVASARDCVPLLSRVRGNRMAKAALENALWEAEANQKSVPLCKLFGGTRQEIPTGVSIGIQNSVEELMEKIATELAAGYQRIKVKVKHGWDLGVLEQIRKRWPDILLSCDANSAYRMDEVDHLRQFDQFNLLMMEQPLWHDDIYYHAQLQKMLKTKLCLDESIRQVRDAELALTLDACRILNIKTARVGGMSEAIAIHDAAMAHGVPVWCGGMLESGVGRVHNIHLSSLENFRLPGDVSASKRYWKEDIVDPEVTVSAQGTIQMPNVAGTGFRIKEDFIEHLTVRKETLRAT
jgi:O-succinylbenzoate synthase